MEQRHKDVLQRNHMYLVEHLDFKDVTFSGTLLTKRLVSDDDLERIQSKTTTKAMASEFLLHILTKRGPSAFRNFMETLMECNMEFVAEQLDARMAETIGEENEAQNQR